MIRVSGAMSMNRRQSLLALLTSLVVTLGYLSTVSSAFAASEKVLLSFSGGDGSSPSGPLVFDAAGNLYGTTFYSGTFGNGTVFKLSPGANNTWTEAVYSFGGKNGKGGAHPYGGLVLDSSGNLYGTTFYGGAYGYGTVFELTLNSSGKWTESVLYSFAGLRDGSNPASTLVFDAAGNLYGTTWYGGDVHGVIGGGDGTVFELSPTEKGRWIEKVLYQFHGDDGANPRAGVVFDAAGNLYGGTVDGGYALCNVTCGVVYKLTPGSNGTWTETVLHRFASVDGGYNEGGVVLDAVGNLYGTTLIGGADGGGTVFKLSPNANGQWREQFYSINSTNGFLTYGGAVLDAAGNIYVASEGSGSGRYLYGSVFKLTLGPNGQWTNTMLHFFDLQDGANPISSLVLDAQGNLYGSSSYGGVGSCTGDGCGVVYEVTP